MVLGSMLPGEQYGHALSDSRGRRKTRALWLLQLALHWNIFFTLIKTGSTQPHGNQNQTAGWWFMLLIPALGRQRQEDLCQFEANLVYKVSSRTAGATQRYPVSKNQNQPTNQPNRQQMF